MRDPEIIRTLRGMDMKSQQKLLMQLHRDQRLPVAYCYGLVNFEPLSLDDLAKKLRKHSKTVRSLKNAGLEALKTMLSCTGVSTANSDS